MNTANEVKEKVSIPKYFYEIIVPQISDYYSDYGVDFEYKPVCKCPLHDEDTPSMRYYEETNTFYCFGCGAGGDVIELHRRFIENITGNKPSFSESVKFLYGYFIRGNEETSNIAQLKDFKVNIELSNNIEMIQYKRYMDNLEKSLLADRGLDLSIKKQIWNYIDTIQILVSTNKLNATKGKESVMEFMHELDL